MQSDCFGIQRFRKRPIQIVAFGRLYTYIIQRRWNVIKDTSFQPSLVDKKAFKMWLLLGTS